MSNREPQDPRSAPYDGWLYATFVEPRSAGLYRLVADQVPEGSRVLDAGCGTGGLAMSLAARCREVVGVDLSPRQVRFARGACRRRGIDNVRFLVADASRLDDFDDRHFDLACMLMAVHEMPAQARAPVIAELLRVAKTAVVIDFHVPLRWNPRGLWLRGLEILAGPAHLSGFLSYCRAGGLAPVAEAAGAVVVRSGRLSCGNLAIHTLRAGG